MGVDSICLIVLYHVGVYIEDNLNTHFAFNPLRGLLLMKF